MPVPTQEDGQEVEKAVGGCHMSGPETRIWPADDDGSMLTMMMQPKFLVIPRAESRGSWSSGWGPHSEPCGARVSVCTRARSSRVSSLWLRQTKLQALCSSSADAC